MKRNIYLEMKSLSEARELFLTSFDWIAAVGTERIAAAEALGRVTAEPVFAAYSSPGYNSAAMDGVALRAADTFDAREENPLRLALGEGAFPVNTGNPLPSDTDAVVMVEQLQRPDPQSVELRAAAFPWQHVRRVGEDIVAGELIFPHHHQLRATDVAALITAGVFRLQVLGRPQVAILPTGDELLHWQEAEQEAKEMAPDPGVIIESNSLLLAGLVREAGGEPTVLPRMPDDPEALKTAVDQAVRSEAQLIMINAGVSAGSKDYTPHVLKELGRVLVHGITIMPGKPTLLGEVRGKPVVGTPGFPVSAWVCFDQLVRPALALMQGQLPQERDSLPVTPARKLASQLGREEFLRVHLGRVGQRIVATPLKRGAGAITSLTRADGLLRIDAQCEGIDEEEQVPAEILGHSGSLEHTLVVVGSHDVTIDHLADSVRRRAPQLKISASNLGSLAGLMAIRAGRCHMGGTHLLDPETGEYNVSYIKRHLAHVPVQLVTLAFREQGLMVRRGNPKQIRSLEDLSRPDTRFINRQGGSGTRVLLDYHLGRLGLAADRIKGYEQEEYTHMAVAAQVLSGSVDAGLGILAAARALQLDFIPIATERYDLCIPHEHLEDPRVKAVLEVLRSDSFKELVASLGGYDVSPMGSVAWEG